ncbi:MarR family transcriptional regulator, partial [Streptomyces sp. SID6137]|nr:MarR family transcriptional regulator [Streptomyces sp. SID6137]
LHAARGAVYAIEERMIESIPARRLTALLADLDTMTGNLEA